MDADRIAHRFLFFHHLACANCVQVVRARCLLFLMLLRCRQGKGRRLVKGFGADEAWSHTSRFLLLHLASFSSSLLGLFALALLSFSPAQLLLLQLTPPKLLLLSQFLPP